MNLWYCLFLFACVFTAQGLPAHGQEAQGQEVQGQKVQGQEKTECYKYGAKNNPGKSCEDILKQRCMETPEDGIYWIALSKGNEEQKRPFPVYCDMKSGGWTMVFKAIAGVPGRVAGYWKLPYSTSEYSLEALNKRNSYKKFYKNRIVQNWDKFSPKEARVVMYRETMEKMALRFEIDGSDNMNWFSERNLREAPWEDILSEKKNYFVLEGPCWNDKCRDFHINNNYQSCTNDQGWLSVGDARECKWETRFLENAFVFSKGAKMANYNEYAKISSAEVFAVYLR